MRIRWLGTLVGKIIKLEALEKIFIIGWAFTFIWLCHRHLFYRPKWYGWDFSLVW